MMPESKLLILLTVLMLIMVNSIYTTTYMHEGTHKAIFKTFSIDSTITYLPFGGYTTPNVTTQFDQANYARTVHYNLLNEILGYNIISVQMTILLTGFMISLAIILRGENR